MFYSVLNHCSEFYRPLIKCWELHALCTLYERKLLNQCTVEIKVHQIDVNVSLLDLMSVGTCLCVQVHSLYTDPHNSFEETKLFIIA